MTPPRDQGPPERAAGRIRWGHVIPAAVLVLGALAVCGALGMWQWNRASEQGEVRQPDPPVAIAEVAAPATTADTAIGRDVWADGAWADADVALVPGREVDGAEAVMVVRAFAVSADATGTGEPATLPVVVGWLAPEDVAGFDTSAPETTRIDGVMRSAEGAAPAQDPDLQAPQGAFWADRLSPAVLAQHWESPLYSALLTAHEPGPGLRVLPEPEAERSLDFRSLTYAIEWWLFGAFFVFVGMRWIRDNGRARPQAPPASPAESPASQPGEAT
ncbi:SURF1 family cytochrome oxidase biogenesis protein [Demequina sp. NBRC 110053]|uniref:SURF1 family cytochrome oxidase biogenesis protein n=1 Tax=Demequina sp. NBRC 110053 TaxID=1570342 RepID=UPI000A078AE3|nr:SURF1 family cytochrome oxidase biogenesis protein [Demequina sp. NBRC 110053]